MGEATDTGDGVVFGWDGAIVFPRCRPRPIFGVVPHIVEPKAGMRGGEWSLICYVRRASVSRLAVATIFARPIVVEWQDEENRHIGDAFVQRITYSDDAHPRLAILHIRGDKALTALPLVSEEDD